jgi:hypothetical protein
MFSYLQSGIDLADKFSERIYSSGIKVGEHVVNNIPVGELNPSLLNDTVVSGKAFLSNLPGNATNLASTVFPRDQLSHDERLQQILNKKKPLDLAEREFVLRYAGDTNQDDDSNPLLRQLGNIGLGGLIKKTNEREPDEKIDQLYKNLIVIVDHFFSYGFIKPIKAGKRDQDAPERVTHYWQLVTKFFGHLDSVGFINETLADKTDQNKALSWLILVMNEEDVLFDCFRSIFTNGSFLSHYSEETSYLYLHRSQLLHISQ